MKHLAGGLVVHASTSPTKRLALNTDIGGTLADVPALNTVTPVVHPRPGCFQVLQFCFNISFALTDRLCGVQVKGYVFT